MPKIDSAVKEAGLVSEKAADTPKAGTVNGVNSDHAQGFVSRIENLYDDLEKERSEYMLRCKDIREGIREVLDEAKEHGIGKTALKAVIKTRALERKLEELRDDLEPDQQETYDQIRHALGDLAELPLGQAALDKSGAAALDSLTH